MKTQQKKAPASSKGSGAKPQAKKGSPSSENGSIEKSKLMKLFEDGLKDIYWVEKQLVKTLPKIASKATSPDLKEAIQDHLTETEGHVQKVEQVFEILSQKAQAKKCKAMEGILEEGDEHIGEADKGAMRDAVIIEGTQKVEHYEIASYGTLRTFAQILGEDDAAGILEEILEEEKGADEKLTSIALSVNVEASEEDEDEEDK